MTTHVAIAELLGLARSGDERAFAELAGLHRARLWSICLRITGNQYDAEDALQDALTAAWVHLPRFRGDAAFGTWAYRIAANAALAVVRRRRETPTELIEQLDRPSAGDIGDRVADRDRVNAALARIPAPFREALVLREYGDLSYEEIAVHQGIGVQTVKSRLNRARAAVLAELARQDTG